jgi:hypothetical protein
VIKFLIQTIDGQVKHDFAFHLIQAIGYQNWLRNEQVYDYTLSEAPEGYPDHIPIGSLEYVFSYMERYHNVNRGQIRPINIPLALRGELFTGRTIYVAKKEEIPSPAPLFVKSHTTYKTFTDVIENTDSLPEDEYMVSNVVEFDSEWRIFVQNGVMVGLKQYVGDFLVFPHIEAIQSMISAYSDAPPSYTLDVGVINKSTVVIEVHPFVSCGLYGFQDYKRLPSMMIQGYNHMKREAEK